MKGAQPIIILAFQAMALAMAALSLALVGVGTISLDLAVVVLAIGLFGVAIAGLVQSLQRLQDDRPSE